MEEVPLYNGTLEKMGGACHPKLCRTSPLCGCQLAILRFITPGGAFFALPRNFKRLPARCYDTFHNCLLSINLLCVTLGLQERGKNRCLPLMDILFCSGNPMVTKSGTEPLRMAFTTTSPGALFQQGLKCSSVSPGAK